MAYYVKLDFSLLKSKDEKKFLELFRNKKYKSHIKAKSESSVIISIPLFTQLEYEIEYTKGFVSKLRVDLLKKDEVSKKSIETVLANIKINSPEYDELLRKIRF